MQYFKRLILILAIYIFITNIEKKLLLNRFYIFDIQYNFTKKNKNYKFRKYIRVLIDLGSKINILYFIYITKLGFHIEKK